MNPRPQRIPAAPPPLPSRDRWLAITAAGVRGQQGAAPRRSPKTPQQQLQEIATKTKGAFGAAIGPTSSRALVGGSRLSIPLRTAIAPLRKLVTVISRPLDAITPLPEPVAPRRAGEPMRQGLERALARELRRGGRMLTIAAVVVFVWAGLVPLSGAVVVGGRLVVQSSVKKVQHPQGGVVTAIRARNGDKVAAGEELARLDQTLAHSNLQIIARQLDEVRIRIARLTAERDNASTPRWPAASIAQLGRDEREQLLTSEKQFFAARANTRRGQQELAETRITQLEQQIAGLEAQLKSNGKQMGIASGELKGVEDLLRQKLVTLPRATALQREAAHLDGIDGQLASQIAETRAKVSETRLQALQAEQTFRSDVMRDLREAEAKEGELMERHLAAQDQMTRTIIRAPTAGIVHELAVHTIGGVIGPAEVLMLIVPESETLAINARLGADKVDQVRAGQTARVRLSAFNQHTTPELVGVVALVSADIVREPQSNAMYYDVTIDLPPAEVHRLGRLQLIPGMPAEVFLQTESRTMLSYLFKPLTDQLSRMFRER